MTDALYEQHAAADVVTTATLKAHLRGFEQRMTIKGAAGLVLLGGFLGLPSSSLGDGPVSDEPTPAWAETMQGVLVEALSDLRREMLARFDRQKIRFDLLEKRVDEHTKRIKRELREGRVA